MIYKVRLKHIGLDDYQPMQSKRIKSKNFGGMSSIVMEEHIPIRSFVKTLAAELKAIDMWNPNYFKGDAFFHDPEAYKSISNFTILSLNLSINIVEKDISNSTLYKLPIPDT